jgi:alpha-mannosidase
MQIREILLLHHTHTDVGYTHPQTAFWELQRRIIDQAIDLCEDTADFPDASAARWTCETTWPVMHWLSRASSSSIERFRALAKAGRISVGALPIHLSPLANAAEFAHGLRAAKLLRDELGVPIRTAISHDVNGVPWPVTNLLLDAGIDAFLMGINVHSGGFPYQRPRWMNWVSPDGRPLLTYNGTHYNTFGRESRYAEGSTEIMQEGLNAYIARLEAAGHPRDFLMLTATHPTLCDNYPPDPMLPRMVRRWNDEGRFPAIRFVTPEELVDHYHQQPAVPIQDFRGDWSDYWNFGSASSANETRVNRNTARRLVATGFLQTALPASEETTARSLDAWRNLLLFHEHTWGIDRSVQSGNCDPIDEQWVLDAAYAWRARSMTGLLFRDSMDSLAKNPTNLCSPNSVLCFNPTPQARESFIRIPNTWADGTWRHCSSNVARIDIDRVLWDDSNSYLAGPFHFEPNSLLSLSLEKLTPAVPDSSIVAGENVIETEFHRLTYDPETGYATSLYDKKLGREFIDADAEWPFFGFVHEQPDPAHYNMTSGELGRDAYYQSIWDLLHADVDCWQYDWKAQRRGAGKLIDLRIETHADGIALVTRREAPGVKHGNGPAAPSDGFFAHLPGDLIQRIKLNSLAPVVELTATFSKEENRSAEAIYFAFPLDLPKWSAHYDAAGVPVRWDVEQLEGSCKNWVTTSSWASVHNADAGVTLSTPDAPLVQIGDFGFGRPQGFARNNPKPMLLGWAMNNYWMTNFRASQPGPMRFRYELRTHGAFDPVVSTHAGLETACPVEIHPLMNGNAPSRSFLRVANPAILPQQFSPCDDSTGDLLLILQNVTGETATTEVELPGLSNCRVSESNAFGETGAQLGDSSGFSVSLAPRATKILRVAVDRGTSPDGSPLHTLWKRAAC